MLQVGLGPLGIQIAGELHRRELGRIVAAVDPALAGEPFGDVTVQPALAAVADVAVDAAIVTTVSDLRACAPTLHELAARGIAIVSTCEELSWPWDRHPEVARALAAAAEQHGARILGTGVNPGFVMDALAVAATTACAEVRRIEIHRIQDATTRRLPFQKKIGAGLTVEEFTAKVHDASVRHVGLAESITMIADAMGWKLDRVTDDIGPKMATARVTSDFLTVEAGQVCGLIQDGVGYVKGEPLIKLHMEAYLGAPESFDAVRVKGNPPLSMKIAGGVHGDVATASIVVNSIPKILKAAPGVRTMKDMMLPSYFGG